MWPVWLVKTVASLPLLKVKYVANVVDKNGSITKIYEESDIRSRKCGSTVSFE